FSATRFDIVAGFLCGDEITTIQNINGTLCAHHANLCCRPCQVEIGTEFLRTHHNVRAAKGLARDDCDFWDGSLSVSINELGATTNNTGMLLVHAREESRDVDKGDDRNIEGVTAAHEPGRVCGGSNVQGARQLGWLVGNHANGASVDATQANNDVGSVAFLYLQERAVSDDGGNNVQHVIGLVG